MLVVVVFVRLLLSELSLLFERSLLSERSVLVVFVVVLVRVLLSELSLLFERSLLSVLVVVLVRVLLLVLSVVFVLLFERSMLVVCVLSPRTRSTVVLPSCAWARPNAEAIAIARIVRFICYSPMCVTEKVEMPGVPCHRSIFPLAVCVPAL